MKTFEENLTNIAILSEVEMSKIFGGDNNPSGTTTEDEEIWM